MAGRKARQSILWGGASVGKDWDYFGARQNKYLCWRELNVDYITVCHCYETIKPKFECTQTAFFFFFTDVSIACSSFVSSSLFTLSVNKRSKTLLFPSFKFDEHYFQLTNLCNSYILQCKVLELRSTTYR